MRKLAILILIILVLPLVLAIESEDIEYVFKGGQVSYLNHPCWNNGTYCSDTARCNVTIIYPNSSVFVEDGEMTNQGSYHNYTFSTYVFGIYQATFACKDEGNAGGDSVYFKVTPTGDERGYALFLILIIFSASLLILSYIFHTEWLAILSGFLFMGVGVYGMMYGIGDLADLYTRMVSVMALGIGFVFTMYAAYSLFLEEEIEDY